MKKGPLSLMAMMAAAVGIGTRGTATISSDPMAGRPFTRRPYIKRPAQKRARHRHQQPVGYYDQIITDPKFMTRRQRFMHAMGQEIRLGSFFGIRK